VAIAVALGLPVRAQAQAATTIQGHVVSIEAGDIVVDLASQRGAKSGDIIELWRPLRLRHPVTNKMVSDRFRIGSLKLGQVREKLALAKAEGKLDRSAVPGDVVILRRVVVPEPVAEPPLPTAVIEPHDAPPSGETLPSGGQDPKRLMRTLDPLPPSEASKVAAMFSALSGRGLRQRIMAYEGYVRAKPDSPYARVLFEEAAFLRNVLKTVSRKERRRWPRLRHFTPPKEVLAASPLALALELDGPVSGAVIHTRMKGEISYQTTPMRHIGGGYYSVTLPASRMTGSQLEYFIEATNDVGRSKAIVGTGRTPTKLDVRDTPEAAKPDRIITTVSVWTDYADYNRFKGNDRVWQTEGFFGLRFGDTGVRALRTGFGVYRGVGGSLEDLDELELSARKVGLTYGYLETEIGFHHFVGLVVRGAVGLKDDGVAGGGQALIRIGNDLETNMLLGGEILGGVGLRGIAQLELNVFERWPMLIRTEVTNQPAGISSSDDDVRPDIEDALPVDTSTNTNDIGARAIAQVGFRPIPALTLAVRGSYQGRTIKHSGPGFGGAVSFTW